MTEGSTFVADEPAVGTAADAHGTPARVLLGSTVGKKAVMAVTGSVLVLFVVAHVIGNLEFFRGPEAMDGYALWLRRIGAPVLDRGWFLWIERAVLGSSALVHVVAGTQLAVRNHAARPVRYARKARRRRAFPARTMRWGGAAILLFVVYHLLDLSVGALNPSYVAGAVHHNVVADFRRWYVAAAYAAAVGALGLHLYHGSWSALQTLGLNGRRSDRALRLFAAVLATLVTVGFLSVPLAVFAGAGPAR